MSVQKQAKFLSYKANYESPLSIEKAVPPILLLISVNSKVPDFEFQGQDLKGLKNE